MKLLVLSTLAAFLLLPGCIDVSDGDGGLFDREPCIPVLEPETGELEGQWSEPATVGVSEREWQPSPFAWADAGHLERIDTLTVGLEWTNSVRGAADFGIAVGRDGAFRYWNQGSQASLGLHRESLTLDRADLEQEGWTSGDGLDAGPSVSTGAYSAAAPIAYKLSWTATFQPPEDNACDADEDDDSSDSSTGSSTAQAPGRRA